MELLLKPFLAKQSWNLEGPLPPASAAPPASATFLLLRRMARFDMRCPQCGSSYGRDGWFRPQWQAEKPILWGHPSGDYDRCKACYAGNWAVVPGPAAGVDRKWDDHSKELCRLVRVEEERCRSLHPFVESWVARNMHNRKDLRDHGSIDCVTESDPKQWFYGQRWTFDPTNWIYQKAFLLAWPDLAHNMNRNSLGNVFESILGTRNGLDKYGWNGWEPSERDAVVTVCTALSSYANAVYQLAAYTDTTQDDVGAWVRYVTSRAAQPHRGGL